jgi:hypothetical protein
MTWGRPKVRNDQATGNDPAGEPPGSSCPRGTAAKGYSAFTALIRSARPCFASANSIPVLGFV